MTTRRFQAIIYVLIGFCILTMLLSYFSFDFIEIDTAVGWTMEYFALPILIVMTPSCYYIYFKFVRQHETKEYYSMALTKLRTLTRVFIMTLGITFIFMGTTLAMIVLSNAYFGETKTLRLNAKILDFYSPTNRRGYYIKIQDQQLDRIVGLKVPGPYKVGQMFKKTMHIGKWGLLYSEK